MMKKMTNIEEWRGLVPRMPSNDPENDED